MSEIYAQARHVADVKDCWFYHTIDLPEHGVIPGEWDLRSDVDAYLGQIDFRGKRVLELGTASGFLCFEMEKRGADVVAYDLPPGGLIDLIPLARYQEFAALSKGHSRSHGFLSQLHNSYWFCHERLKSKAKVVYGDIYQLPDQIGTVDISTLGSILLHLRDPFLALANAARFTKSTIMVTDVIHGNEWNSRIYGASESLPPPRERSSNGVAEAILATDQEQVETDSRCGFGAALACCDYDPSILDFDSCDGVFA
jgi:SAM-dependent methyltransferase